MSKVLVFDYGFGGERFAKFLQKEMPFLAVDIISEKRYADFRKMGTGAIFKNVDESVEKYVGTGDVIVLASFFVTETTIMRLQKKYPEQRFVGFSIPQRQKFMCRRF